MAAILAGLSTAKALGPLLGAAALIVAGFGAAEAYEHLAPWGLEHQRDAVRASIPAMEAAAAKAGALGQSAADKSAFDAWATQLSDCEGGAKTARDAQASAIAASDKTTSLRASAAYRLGRASCGDPHAAVASPSSGVQSGSVRQPAGDDFADVFGAAPACAP